MDKARNRSLPITRRRPSPGAALALIAALLGLAGGCARRVPASQPASQVSEVPQVPQGSQAPRPAPIEQIRWERHDTILYYLDYPWPKPYYDQQTFTVTLGRDGELRWHGVDIVRVLGDRRVQVDAAEVDRIFAAASALARSADPEAEGRRSCGRWPIADTFIFELGPGEAEVRLGLCTMWPTHPALDALRQRLNALVEAEGWIDRHYLSCRFKPPRRYRFAAATGSIVRRGILHDVAELLRADHRRGVILHAAASRRDPAGAARARAEATVDELGDLGVDAASIEIVDLGTDLAEHAADDAGADADAWIHLDVVDRSCLHPDEPVPPPPERPWWR